MAETMNPMGQVSSQGPMSPNGSSNSSRGAGQMGLVSSMPAIDERPGLVTFAAIMLFVLGGFQLVFAVIEFLNAVWVSANVYGDFSGRLWFWGIVDTIFAVVVFYAAADLLSGGSFGQIVGIAVAGVSAVRWFFYLPAEPWTAVVIIAFDVIIIYALVAHSEYFNKAQFQ